MSLGLKVTPEIKNKLDAAAKANGRTQSQEAEARIAATFRDADYLDQAATLAYGPALAVMLAVIGRAVLEISRFAPFPQSWTDHPNLIDEAAWATGKIVAAFGSGDDLPRGDRIILAPMIVAELLAAVRSPGQAAAAPQLRDWARPLHAKLGAELAARIRHDEFVTASPGEPGRLNVRHHPASPAPTDEPTER